MNKPTALSLQTQERLDLAELKQACRAAGMGVSLVSGYLRFDSDPEFHGRTWTGSWDGEREEPMFSCACRDAVRRVLPGSYCIPITKHQVETYGPMRVRFADEYGLFTLPIGDGRRALPRYLHEVRSLPRWLPGQTETDCWARALVALYRAGLLPGGRA